ncbi:hypothetical protein CDL15_Pgr004747 [Punica granatum]|uniref:Uncharacterized protein n=1 Tax=Punica granatum TaxID=22663 RepID=A0A218W671_PUNGR|nr:hypothetical protein CDL15_Pgr004747 [Punica granatum]PKI56011.1 hypothetical protein CRG98_023598 [Punica granatum]
MACSSPKNHTKYHLRSISLPSKLHPTNLKIEDELNKLVSWSTTSCISSSTSVLEGLSCLEELYISLEEVLQTRTTQQILSKNQQEKCIEEVLEGSVKILDVCAVSRELMSQTKEQVRDLQSTLRRRKAGSSLEVEIARFTQSRKTVKKDAKSLIASMKQMGNEIMATPSSILAQEDDHLSVIIRVLREVNLSSIPVFQFLLSFLTEARPARWSVISRMIPRQEADLSELERIDASMRCLFKPSKGDDTEQLHHTVQKQLGDLELNIRSFEDSLECIFRRLIKTRASLLNIISQ